MNRTKQLANHLENDEVMHAAHKDWDLLNSFKAEIGIARASSCATKQWCYQPQGLFSIFDPGVWLSKTKNKPLCPLYVPDRGWNGTPVKHGTIWDQWWTSGRRTEHLQQNLEIHSLRKQLHQCGPRRACHWVVATTCKNMGCFWSCWTLLNSSYGCGSFILCCSKFPSRCSVSLQSFDLLVLPWILEQPQWLQNFLLQLLQNHLMALFIWSFFVHCFDSWCYSLVLTFGHNTNTPQTRLKHASNTLQFTIYARMLQPPKIGIGATWLKPVRAEV